MKLLPLIGALILSAAPVQAFETFEELDKACQTEEFTNMCAGAGKYVSARATASLLCMLEEKGVLTTENLFFYWEQVNEMIYEGNKDAIWNAGVEAILESFPNCPIKPIR